MARREYQRKSTKKGVVVMIDALGASDVSVTAAGRFIQRRDALLDTMQVLSTDATAGLVDGDEPEDLVHFPANEVATFGDTIFCLLPCSESGFGALLPQINLFIAPLVAASLELGLLMRGAVSYGEYYSEDRTFLGPAIRDAAAWYEQLQSIGIIACPSFSIRYRAAHAKYNQWPQLAFVRLLEQHYLQRTDLKSAPEGMYHLFRWPRIAQLMFGQLSAHNHSLTVSEWFFSKLAEHSQPFGTETKYNNSIRYFEHELQQTIDNDHELPGLRNGYSRFLANMPDISTGLKAALEVPGYS